MKNTTFLFLLLFLITSSPALAQNGYIIGATANTGIPYPAKETDAISLNKQIIELEQFSQKYINAYAPVPLAHYSILNEYENTSGDFKNIQTILPFRIFFSNFSETSRSNILDNLSEIMPDIFVLKGDGEDIKNTIRKNFERRAFIRKFLNPTDLQKLNIDIKIYQDGREVNINKVQVEFRMTRNLTGAKDEVLVMDIQVFHNLQFKPKESSHVQMKYVAPAFYSSRNGELFYSPYLTGPAKGWKGAISETFLVYPMLKATAALPYYIDYKRLSYDYDRTVTYISNLEPEQNEKIGFFSYKQPGCGCHRGDAYVDQVTLPIALTSITASSWHKSTETVPAGCVQGYSDVIEVRWVPDFEEGTSDYALLKDVLKENSTTNDKMGTLMVNDCENEMPKLLIKDKHHPVWAFDIADDSIGQNAYWEEGNFNLNTAWCEGTQGDGIGEYLEFTTNQPVKEIKFFTGFQKDEQTYENNNRVKFFKLINVRTGEDKLLIFSDELISSSYILDLEPGTYRLQIYGSKIDPVGAQVYKGSKSHLSCFSSILLKFNIENDWFNTHYANLKEM